MNVADGDSAGSGLHDGAGHDSYLNGEREGGVRIGTAEGRK
ncbi:hypothetical protein PLANPX_3736 [Lacipirellula parvula]|uniref:Uncharacterized protein n=1 Tax=Lacipirellula parvula TaxID=2650471 RepID=A0A5K7XBF0_9BACT|nr:hypothetical protein PLANPX_3736 [Lacipirellula parvula]